MDAEIFHRAVDLVDTLIDRDRLYDPTDVIKAVRDVYAGFVAVDQPEAKAEPLNLIPAVPVKKSIHPDYLICLDDGKKFKSLKRHLSVLGMTPAQYRAKWGLPPDYPMVCEAYSEARSALAKQIGLGQQAGRRKSMAASPHGHSISSHNSPR